MPKIVILDYTFICTMKSDVSVIVVYSLENLLFHRFWNIEAFTIIAGVFIKDQIIFQKESGKTVFIFFLFFLL